MKPKSAYRRSARRSGKDSRGKARGKGERRIACGNLLFTVSQRNARVSLTTRQSSTRETQTGNHLLKEERIERSPSPTPSHDGEAQKNKDSPDEEEPDPLLRWARIKITGVMKDMVSHLLDTSKPQKRRFANGFGEWEKFGLNSLAVEAGAVARRSPGAGALRVRSGGGGARPVQVPQDMGTESSQVV